MAVHFVRYPFYLREGLACYGSRFPSSHQLLAMCLVTLVLCHKRVLYQGSTEITIFSLPKVSPQKRPLNYEAGVVEA